MEFLKVFLRGIAFLPSVVQSLESLYGAKSGEQKKAAALSIVTAAINVTDAVTQKTIADGPAFSAGLSTIVDGVVAMFECECLARSLKKCDMRYCRAKQWRQTHKSLPLKFQTPLPSFATRYLPTNSRDRL